MPLYTYACRGTPSHVVKKIFSNEKEGSGFCGTPCPTCQEPLDREFRPPSTNVVERLDNGWMPRAVERLSESERLFRERAQLDNKRFREQNPGVDDPEEE